MPLDNHDDSEPSGFGLQIWSSLKGPRKCDELFSFNPSSFKPNSCPWIAWLLAPLASILLVREMALAGINLLPM
jgi:hypothetical protein